MNEKVNIAIVGFGNIGSYFYKILKKNIKKISVKTGKIPVIKYISAKNLNKRRSVKIPKAKWVKNSLTLCSIAFLVLIQFNLLTIALALVSMPLAFSYPLMKRYTYWPQLFLGITFNYGLLLWWTSITNEITFIPFVLYIGAIFWTLGFDTIYGFQDIKDDEIIGLKSTSIKFKSDPKKFLILCY